MEHIETIKAHVFNSLNDANSAINQININQGIPVSEDAVTRTYCDAKEYNGIIYVQADEVTESILGASSDLEITINI